jgi:hypothetical protein
VYFCIRDDDTSFFTSPDELEKTYGDVTKHGPVSLAIIPFCRAGTSKGLPAAYRNQWSIHPLEDNRALVDYLRRGIAEGRYEAMLHGFHHDERDQRREFLHASDLGRKVRDGKQYLEQLLETSIRVFVPPHNAIGKEGLQAINAAGLHLGGVAGMRHGWPWFSPASLGIWWYLKRRRRNGLDGLPYVLEVAGHRELAGTAITPGALLQGSLKRFDEAIGLDGVFCAATHYWEFDQPVTDADARTVGDHLYKLVQRARGDSRVRWQSVGTVLAASRPFGQRP